MMTDFSQRLRSAGLVVAGHRPATTRFDAIDSEIAWNCAEAAALKICLRYFPTTDDPEVAFEILRCITEWIYQAVVEYSHFPPEQEAWVRERVAWVQATPGSVPDIPF